MGSLWEALSDPSVQSTLKFIGGGLVVVAGGAWAVIRFFVDRSKSTAPPPKSSTSVRADRGGLAAGGNLAIDNRRGVTGLQVALLVGVVLGAVLIGASFLGGVTATNGGIAIGGDAVNSTMETNQGAQ